MNDELLTLLKAARAMLLATNETLHSWSYLGSPELLPKPKNEDDEIVCMRMSTLHALEDAAAELHHELRKRK